VEPPLSTEPKGLARALGLAALLALAACGEPQGLAFEPSPLARTEPRPGLGPSAPLRAAAERAEDDAARLADAAAALGARRDAAQARGAALEGPVVDPALRQRLLRAAGGA
jgi:hypothetical protein